jgi:hypothetical protein
MSQKNFNTRQLERKYIYIPKLHGVARKYRATLSGSVLTLSNYLPKKPQNDDKKSVLTAETAPAKEPTKRGKVTGFSIASKRRLVKYSREIPKDRFKSFITLTYPIAPDPLEAKAHLDRIIQEIRRLIAPLDAPRRPVSPRQTRGGGEQIAKMQAARAARTVPRRPVPPRRFSEKYEREAKSKQKKKSNPRKRGNKKPTELSILWVMEFQERGAIHFHLWCSHFVGKNRLRLLWNRIIKAPIETPSTDVRAWRAYSKSGLSCYVAKYANKQMQKTLPPELAEQGAGRWWGIIGDVSRPLFVTTEITAEDCEEFNKRAAELNYKHIQNEWVRLYVVPENERDTLQKLLESIRQEREDRLQKGAEAFSASIKKPPD